MQQRNTAVHDGGENLTKKKEKRKTEKKKQTDRRVLSPTDVGELHEARRTGLLLAFQIAWSVPLSHNRRYHLEHHTHKAPKKKKKKNGTVS